MAKLVNAKCPNCGATLKLAKDDEKVTCEYCNNTIIVDEAIASYKLKVSGSVSVEGITTDAELIEAANELLDMNEFLKAKRKFLEFSERCPDKYQGWIGLLICRTRNFTIKDNNIMFENDVNKYYEHFMRVAPDDVKKQYFETIDRYFNPEKYKKIDAEKIAEQLRVEQEEKNKKEEELKKIRDVEKEKKREDKLNSQMDKSVMGITTESKTVASKIGNGFLYFLGGLFILMGLVSTEDAFGERLLTILLGLSLFGFIYNYFNKKNIVPIKYITIIRIILPFLLLIIVSSVYNGSHTDNSSNNQMNSVDETNQ